MNECTIIIIGITGDLAKRKLIPSLYKLIAQEKIKKFVLIGASLEDTTKEAVLESALPYIPSCTLCVWQKLCQATYYTRVNALNIADFTVLNELTLMAEQEHQLSGNRLLYCATASDFFCAITQHAVETGLIKPNVTSKPWHRIVYEKPFGRDTFSAHSINNCIERLIHESQIYRIDHYLTEEIISNIALVRFTNLVFEPLWNNHYISQVQIILNEKVCLGNRGGYYDGYGALKDMFQNHMLELLALIAMEPPKKLTGEQIRSQRAHVLSKVRVVDALLGQYDGYRHEIHVAPDSNTETFVATCLMIDNSRWSGVPFFLKTGKGLAKKETAIHIKFKQVDCLLAKQCPSDSNYLTIQVTPNPSFYLTLNVKKPGFAQEVTPVVMEFCHSCFFKEHSLESYEVLLDEVMRGEHSVSVRFDEIEHAWNVVDTIKSMNLPVHFYEQNSSGPIEMEFFNQKYGVRWRA